MAHNRGLALLALVLLLGGALANDVVLEFLALDCHSRCEQSRTNRSHPTCHTVPTAAGECWAVTASLGVSHRAPVDAALQCWQSSAGFVATLYVQCASTICN